MRPTTARRTLLAVTAASAFLLLTGCSTGSTGTAELGAQPAVAELAIGAPAQDSSGKAEADRSIVRTSTITVRVPDLMQAADQYRALATRFGGEVSDEYLGNDGANAFSTLTARIPAETMTQFLEEVRGFGQVLAQSTSANDVTLAVADVDARVRALTTSTERLRALLDEATRLADIVAIESELATRQAELDGLLAQQRALKDQVAMSTVTATFTPEVVDQATPAPGFLAGLQSGWNALVSAASSATTLLGMVLPFAVMAGLLVIAGTTIRRAARHRGRRYAGRSADDRAGDGHASE